MISYDQGKPLIVIHIPKAGGTSSRKVFQAWFHRGYIRHYYDEVAKKMPTAHDLEKLHSSAPVLVHGHFNRLRNFGVQDYYPQVKQFITILRDPYEQAISHYFFTRSKLGVWGDESRIPKGDLASYLETTPPNMLNHFPRIVNLQNYKEIIEKYFVEIGITEQLEASMSRIARKLNKPFNSEMLGRENATPRDQQAPEYYREIFQQAHPLEFHVYKYALMKFNENT